MQSAITIGCDEKGNVELSLWRILNSYADDEEWKLIIKTKRYHDVLRLKETLNLDIEQITFQDNENEFVLIPNEQIKAKPELWTGDLNGIYQEDYVEQMDNGDYKITDKFGSSHIVSKEDFNLSNEC